MSLKSDSLLVRNAFLNSLRAVNVQSAWEAWDDVPGNWPQCVTKLPYSETTTKEAIIPHVATQLGTLLQQAPWAHDGVPVPLSSRG